MNRRAHSLRWLIVVSLVVIIAVGVVSVTVPAPLVGELTKDLSASTSTAGEMTMMLVILTISIVALLRVFVIRGFGFATEWTRIADRYSRPALVAHTPPGAVVAGQRTEAGGRTEKHSTNLPPTDHPEG